MIKDKKTQPFTVSNLIHLIQKGKINFNPVYQRGYVWKKNQKELFIDSMLLGYDIPKIYLHDNPNGTSRYDVVDGQQRLLTIIEFVTNKLKLPSESDPINGEPIANMHYDELPLDLQMDFQNINLDAVVLNTAYTQDDIEDMFLRYQNGEPLNAAEKRKAIAGNFKEVVKELGLHKVFEKCAFNDDREGYQDAVAKVLHIRIHGNFTSITPASIKRTYLNNQNITTNNEHVKDIQRAFNFINSAFSKSSNPTPKIKKFGILTFTEIIHHLIEFYAVSDFKKEIADAYLKFETLRISNVELEEEDQDPTLSSYTDAARGDSPAQQQFRYETLLNFILKDVAEITTKDQKRAFTDQQRIAIYQIYEGVCQECQVQVEFTDFHADHKKPHSAGGVTKIANGQVLCSSCNLKKSASQKSKTQN
ncbi:MAG: HNH endonuclease family protein [Sediminibacterium sp.]